MEKLFVIGASNFQLPAIIEAKKMGIYVAVADYNPNAVGVPYADEFYNVSTIDEEGILNAVKEFRADGIITLCTDMPIRALANACEKLSLPGIDLETAVTATDKEKMIQAFDKNGVEHPGYFVLSKGKKVSQYIDKLSYPVITKPTDNSGSRGIMLCSNEKELETAVKYSSENGRVGDVIVEEFMDGPEFSVELMVVNGTVNILQVTDKLTTGAPHFVEIGHSQPSRMNIAELDEIKDLAKRAAIAVGICNGPAHAEIIFTKEGPKMVEIGARMGGGCITTHLVPLSTGINMTKATILTSLGKIPDLTPKISKGAAIRFIIPYEGEVVSISGKEEAEKIPGVKCVEIQCRIGDYLTELENGTSRIGYIIAQGNTADEAIQICDEAMGKIKIKTRR